MTPQTARPTTPASAAADGLDARRECSAAWLVCGLTLVSFAPSLGARRTTWPTLARTHVSRGCHVASALEREPSEGGIGDGARDARRGATRAARGARWPTLYVRAQLFYSFFKTLVGKEVVVELKNGDACARARACAARVVVEPRMVPRADLAIRGTLHSVDQYLNVKLLNVSIDDTENFPHMVRSPPSLTTFPHPHTRLCASAPPLRGAAIRQELFRAGLGHQIRAAALLGGRHRPIAGRDAARPGAAKEMTTPRRGRGGAPGRDIL